MTVKNDPRPPLLIFGEQAGTVCTELRENCPQGLSTMTILERLDVDAAGKFFAKVLGEFHFAADGVIMLDYPSYKTNDDHWGIRRYKRCGRDSRPVVALHHRRYPAGGSAKRE